MACLLRNYDNSRWLCCKMADKSCGFILHAIKCCRARRQTLFSLLLTLAAKRQCRLIGISLTLLVLHGNSANLATARSVKRSCQTLKRNTDALQQQFMTSEVKFHVKCVIFLAQPNSLVDLQTIAILRIRP